MSEITKKYGKEEFLKYIDSLNNFTFASATNISVFKNGNLQGKREIKNKIINKFNRGECDVVQVIENDGNLQIHVSKKDSQTLTLVFALKVFS